MLSGWELICDIAGVWGLWCASCGFACFLEVTFVGPPAPVSGRPRSLSVSRLASMRDSEGNKIREPKTLGARWPFDLSILLPGLWVDPFSPRKKGEEIKKHKQEEKTQSKTGLHSGASMPPTLPPSPAQWLWSTRSDPSECSPTPPAPTARVPRTKNETSLPGPLAGRRAKVNLVGCETNAGHKLELMVSRVLAHSVEGGVSFELVIIVPFWGVV